MKLMCLGSSSSGNCYLLRASNDEVLIVECGIAVSEIKRALRWKLGSVAGCLVSHAHLDHAKYLGDVLRCGIRVFALAEVFQALGTFGLDTLCRAIVPLKGYRVGGFKVIPLPVAHDVPCAGFIIEHAEMGRLLFITDTMMLEYKLPGLDHIMLECNYADAILQANIKSGAVPTAMAQRVMTSHMELETAKSIIRANDMQSVQEIVLIHLSAANSDAGRFAREIEQVAARPVYVAAPGFEVELSKTPY